MRVGSGSQLERDDEDFGRLVYHRCDGWIRPDFSLWGAHPVELLIDAGPEGPTPEQRAAFRRFDERRRELLESCLRMVTDVGRDLGQGEQGFVLRGLTIPSLTGTETSDRLWTLWFDAIEDDHFMFGVQTEDDWNTLVAFADD